MLRYFCDMLFGLFMGVISFFFLGFFEHPVINSWLLLLAIGVVFPCLGMGVYSMVRYLLVKEKPVEGTYIWGFFGGIILSAEMLGISQTYFSKDAMLNQGIRTSVEELNSIGESLFSGMLMSMAMSITVITTIAFFRVFIKNRNANVNIEQKKRAEIFGSAFYFPIAGYCFIILAVPEFCKSMVSYKEAENSPIVVGFAWAGSLFICLVATVLIYIVVKGRNIPYVLAAYIAEAALFLLCIKRFQLPFPYIPLVGLGGTIVLGAGIYKGLEKLFAFAKERWE